MWWCTARIAPLIELGAGFDMDLTARENIYLNGTVLGLTPKYIDEKFDEIVDFSELREFLDVPLKNYSSGMVARIAFAIATITKPDVLIADEILSVGDFMFQEKCEERMRQLMSGGTTVLSGEPLHRPDRAHVRPRDMAGKGPRKDAGRSGRGVRRIQGAGPGGRSHSEREQQQEDH